MDGTPVDTEPLWLSSETALAARYGYNWKTEDQANCLGGPLDRVGQYIFSKVGEVESPEYFTDTLIDLVVQAVSQSVPMMDGAAELLQFCEEEQIPIALVSASPRILVDAVLRGQGKHRFEVSISCDDVTRVKPDPQGYHMAAD